MNIIDSIIGRGTDLNSMQMTIRTVIIFFVALLMLRIAGIRTFGKKTAFDNVITIMLGAVLSRAIAGSSPFIPTILSALVMVVIHRILAMMGYRSEAIGKIIKGDKIELFSDGKSKVENMKKVQISEKDIYEEIRLQMHRDDLNGIKKIFIENTGEVSILKE